MSSFIPSSEHFNSLEAGIIRMLNNKDFSFPYALKDTFPGMYNRHVQGVTEVKQVFDTLRELTALCVTIQYKNHYQGTLDQEIQEQTAILKQDKRSMVVLTIHGVLKGLQCLN